MFLILSKRKIQGKEQCRQCYVFTSVTKYSQVTLWLSIVLHWVQCQQLFTINRRVLFIHLLNIYCEAVGWPRGPGPFLQGLWSLAGGRHIWQLVHFHAEMFTGCDWSTGRVDLLGSSREPRQRSHLSCILKLSYSTGPPTAVCGPETAHIPFL